MIIVQLAGGLGNQMFQYALYLRLKELGKEVKIDDVSGFAEDAERGPALSAFGIEYERASVKELRKMLDSSPMLWHKVRRKLFGRRKKAYFEEDKLYHPEILTWDDIYLEGYWQTEKYFEPIEEQVRQTYDTDKLLRCAAQGREAAVEDWMGQIMSTESVGVHVRGGDYLLPQNQELFGGNCTAAYYREAMRQMKEEHPGCRFFLFTNDRRLAAELTDNGGPGSDAGIVDLGGRCDYAEFVLMSRCRHNILANSSFSWWASYLNRYPDKTVIAPAGWLNGWDCRDIYRRDMRRIGPV